MSDRANETAPVRTDAASGSLAATKPLDYTQSSWPRRWALLSERRRTARELDQLLGCDRYPDVRLAYGLRGGDEEAAALRQARAVGRR